MRTTRWAAPTLLAAALAAAPAGAAAGASCTPTWRLVTTPAGQDTQPVLTSVTELSAHDLWMTGDDGPAPWVLRSNGKSVEAATPPPAIPGEAYTIGKTSFASDSEGWALAGGVTSFAERWHGGRWTMTQLAVSPDPVNKGQFLSDLATLSADDAWAVGDTYQAGKNIFPGATLLGALIEHWDGTGWTIVANPVAERAGASLNAIDARSATDVWAVGRQDDGNGGVVPLAEHFDGISWTVVPTPAGAPPAALDAVSATAVNDVWAVGGQTQAGTANTAVPFVEHFDGTAWHVATGLPDVGNAKLTGVYASGPDDVWALAQIPGAANLLLHWDGASWSTTTLPGPQENGLGYVYHALDGTGPDDVWAVGTVVDRFTVTETPQVAHLSCGKD